VPDGVPRERLKELLAGRLWPDVRAAAISGPGLPGSWEQAVRWYRRGSRERRLRETAGTVVAAILEELRAAESTEGLRRSYVEHDGDRSAASRPRSGSTSPTEGGCGASRTPPTGCGGWNSPTACSSIRGARSPPNCPPASSTEPRLVLASAERLSETRGGSVTVSFGQGL
jgi:hypothetical protein